MRKKNKQRNGKGNNIKEILIHGIKWGLFYFFIIITLSFIFGGLVRLEYTFLSFFLGFVFGLIIKKFEKYRFWIKSLAWTFAFWHFFLIMLINSILNSIKSFDLVDFVVYFIITFAVFFGASLLLNRCFDNLSKRVKELSILFAIIKAIIMGIILLGLVIFVFLFLLAKYGSTSGF